MKVSNISPPEHVEQLIVTGDDAMLPGNMNISIIADRLGVVLINVSCGIRTVGGGGIV